MGIVGRKETERRLRIMARSMVDMERGIYQWPDGRKPLRPDGSPVISKAECARSAGYSGTNNQRNMDSWFEDPYFLRQLEMERARREINMQDLVQHEENLPLAIAKGLFQELLIRLEKDPASVTTAQILTFAPALHKYGLELAALNDMMQSAKDGKLDDFNGTVSGNVVDMNPAERDRLVASTQQAADERMAHIRLAIAKANVTTEEPADAGGDGRQSLAADGTISS